MNTSHLLMTMNWSAKKICGGQLTVKVMESFEIRRVGARGRYSGFYDIIPMESQAYHEADGMVLRRQTGMAH